MGLPPLVGTFLDIIVSFGSGLAREFLARSENSQVIALPCAREEVRVPKFPASTTLTIKSHYSYQTHGFIMLGGFHDPLLLPSWTSGPYYIFFHEEELG